MWARILLVCILLLGFSSYSLLGQDTTSSQDQVPQNYEDLLLKYKSLKNEFSKRLEIYKEQLKESTTALSQSQQQMEALSNSYATLQEVNNDLQTASDEIQKQYQELGNLSQTLSSQLELLKKDSEDSKTQVSNLKNSFDNLMTQTQSLIDYSVRQEKQIAVLSNITTVAVVGTGAIVAIEVARIFLPFLFP